MIQKITNLQLVRGEGLKTSELSQTLAFKVTLNPVADLESPVKITCMSLDCGKTQVRTHAGTGRMWKNSTQKGPCKPVDSNPGPWGITANHWTDYLFSQRHGWILLTHKRTLNPSNDLKKVAPLYTELIHISSCSSCVSHQGSLLLYTQTGSGELSTNTVTNFREADWKHLLASLKPNNLADYFLFSFDGRNHTQENLIMLC